MTDVELKNATFKYTIPVTKSNADEDGLYIYGEASGPEVDVQDERFSEDAINSFADQIRERASSGDPIPYLDEHEKDGGRGVLKHLGDLVDGGITNQGHLWVKVRLFEDNPAATFLYRSIQQGKKFGMSVSGDVLSFSDEIVKSAGKRVRTFKSMILKHIANTTKPVWTPSFGTVLNRAVEKALSEGENMAEEIVVESTKVEATPATDETKTDVVAQAVTETVAQPDEAANDINGKLDKIASAVLALAELVKPKELATETPEPATDKSEPVDSTSTAVTVEKSADEKLADLAAELENSKKEIEALKNASISPRPPVVKAQAEEFSSLIKSMEPSERLRLALQAKHEGE